MLAQRLHSQVQLFNNLIFQEFVSVVCLLMFRLKQHGDNASLLAKVWIKVWSSQCTFGGLVKTLLRNLLKWPSMVPCCSSLEASQQQEGDGGKTETAYREKSIKIESLLS